MTPHSQLRQLIFGMLVPRSFTKRPLKYHRNCQRYLPSASCETQPEDQHSPRALREVCAANVRPTRRLPHRRLVDIAFPDKYQFTVHQQSIPIIDTIADQFPRKGGRTPPLGLYADGAPGLNPHVFC